MLKFAIDKRRLLLGVADGAAAAAAAAACIANLNKFDEQYKKNNVRF